MTQSRGRRPGARRGRGFAARRLWVAAVLIAVTLVAGGVTAWLVTSSGDGGDGGPPSAAIVDQLSLSFPNPGFVQRATSTLEDAGYRVDYYPGEDVTVDFFRRLPEAGYDVIVFRNHADRLQAIEPSGERFDEVILFTSEEYDRNRYVPDQAANRLVIASYYEGEEPGYFGISARFVRDAMIGSFDGTTVIMMGCEGLLTDATAKAFVDKGASAYISWDETVSAAHTDEAGEALLRHLLVDGLSPQDATARTMDDVGPDPVYGSKLVAYPPAG